MAPEQACGGAQWLDGRADLWALGVILYEMLAGRRPFQAATASDLREEILHREPKPLRMIDDTIPAGLEAICLKCLSKDVKGRFSSARDLIKALRKCWRQPSANGEGPRPFFHRWCHQFSARLSIGRLGCAFVVTVASLLLCVTALLYSKLKTPQVVVLPSPNLPACPAPGI
jgi:serine/threonine-protein kinase